MGMGRNGKSLMGIPWEWELVTKLGMGMGRNGNRLNGNGREWECKKPFPGISSTERTKWTELPVQFSPVQFICVALCTPKMQQIARICTHIFNSIPKPLPLRARPPSHVLKASAPYWKCFSRSFVVTLLLWPQISRGVQRNTVSIQWRWIVAEWLDVLRHRPVLRPSHAISTVRRYQLAYCRVTSAWFMSNATDARK